MVAMIEQEGAGYDFGAYRDAPPGFRIWCGATVEASDVALLTQWLDWAYAEACADAAQACVQSRAAALIVIRSSLSPSGPARGRTRGGLSVTRTAPRRRACAAIKTS